MKKATITILLTLLMSSSVFSFSAGVTGSTFLKIGIGARPVALGSAYTAVSDDANCIFWNPAGLGQTYALGGTVSFLNLFKDVNYGAGAFVVRLKALGVLGIGGAFLSASDVRRDANGTETGTFSNYDAMFILSFGREIYGENLFGGVSVRGIQSKLGNRTARTATLDGGVLFVPHPVLRLGAALKNVGPGIVFISERDLPPTELRTGSALVLPLNLESFILKTTLSADLGFSEFSKISAGFGGELTLLPTDLDLAFKGFSLRGGYQPVERTGDWSGWSFGLGAMVPLGKDNYFSIDAVHYSYGYLGGADRVSFTLKI